MEKKLITLTTDFGDQFAVVQLHAVTMLLGFWGRVIENHSVTAFSILEGAFEIDVLADFSPHDTIHVGVVDPGVGSRRRGIVIRTKKSWYVGPDNGLLYPAAVDESIQQVWELNESKIGGTISHTFHGRDVFIKAAVYLAKGKKPEDFGSRKIDPAQLIKLKIKQGQVVHIDNYGNVKVFYKDHLRPGNTLQIKIKGKKFSVPIVKTFSDVEQGKPLALLGSSGTLELAINYSRGDTFFGAKLGDVLQIEYAK